ncbi:hypothetical protein PFISCL1PPCAC_23443, partial [Pristionchus fissidentatus]
FQVVTILSPPSQSQFRMNYRLPLLLSTFICHIAAQGCGCRGSSCGQSSAGGCSSGGCSDSDVGNSYARGSYQRDEGGTFKESLERLGSKRRRGRHGKKSESRRKKMDEEEDDYEEEDDRYRIGSLNSVSYDSDDDNDRRRKPAKIKDPKRKRFRFKRAKRDAEEDPEKNERLCNSILIKRGLETGMTSLLNSNQTTPLALSPASSLHALMKTRSKKAPAPWGIICGPADSLDQLDLAIDTKMYCYYQVGETSCFAFKI